MSWTTALLLALLQGLTEFLPVSSSGHLALLQSWLVLQGADIPGALGFDLLLHLGTLLAVAVYFRKDLAALARGSLGPAPSLTGPGAPSHNARRELALLGLALLPTVVIGLGLRNLVTVLLHRPVAVALLVGVTGVILLASRAAPGRSRAEDVLTVTWWQALGIGAAQGLAVLPGLSRSGLTIVAGMALGLPPLRAFRWSFLLALPTIAGAVLLEAPAVTEVLRTSPGPALAGAATAALVALLALALLSRLLRGARFHHFAWYCFAVAAAGVVIFGGGT